MSSFMPPRPATAVVLSVLAHCAIGQGLAGAPRWAKLPEPARAFEVEMAKEPEPPPVKPEPPAPPPEPPKVEPMKPEPAPKVAAKEPEPAKETSPAEPPPASEPAPPAEPGFITAPGEGDGPGVRSGQLGSLGSRAPMSRPIAPAPAPRPAPAPAAPREVSFKDLSERPHPPRLDDALERNYPAAARLQGRAGEAKVLLTVSSQGQVTAIRVVGASDPDFGEACKRTLLGTRWSSPLDRDGRAVGTLVPYQCKFRVRP